MTAARCAECSRPAPEAWDLCGACGGWTELSLDPEDEVTMVDPLARASMREMTAAEPRRIER